jgi:hypothetical protein
MKERVRLPQILPLFFSEKNIFGIFHYVALRLLPALSYWAINPFKKDMAPERCHFFLASEPNAMFLFLLNDLYWNFLCDVRLALHSGTKKEYILAWNFFSRFNYNIETKLIVTQFSAAAQYLSARMLKKHVPQDGVIPPSKVWNSSLFTCFKF